MSNKGKITVHIDQEHACGQVHEMIYHIQEGNVNFPIELPLLLPAHLGSFAPYVEKERKLEFSGTFSDVELNGVVLEGNQLVCAKCSDNIIFPFWFYEATE